MLSVLSQHVVIDSPVPQRSQFCQRSACHGTVLVFLVLLRASASWNKAIQFFYCLEPVRHLLGLTYTHVIAVDIMHANFISMSQCLCFRQFTFYLRCVIKIDRLSHTKQMKKIQGFFKSRKFIKTL